MRAPWALLVGLGVLGACAHDGAGAGTAVGMSTAPVMPADQAAPAQPSLPGARAVESALWLLPARVQVMARLEVERLATAFGGRAGLLELLPLRRALGPEQWEPLLAGSELIWFGVDLRETDGRGFPDRLLVLSGEFADRTAQLVEPPVATIAAPLAIGIAEPVWPEAFGARHVVIGRQKWHRDARGAASDPNERFVPPLEFGPDAASAGPTPAALELWAMLDEPTVREWTGPFADAFLRPLVLRLADLRALQLSLEPGAETTTLRFTLHARDAAQLAELQAALQTVLDSVRNELTEPAQRALFGEPRAVVEAGRAQVSWTLPSALVLGHARAVLR